MSNFPYLSDRRDQILMGAAPMLMVPRFGELQPPLLGQVRYLAAHDGIYVEGLSHAVHACLRISPKLTLPYGPVRPFARLVNGSIPTALLEAAGERASQCLPHEWGGVIVWTGQQYELVEPPAISRSGGHITYDASGIDKLSVAVDVHSHGASNAFFSATDDQDDLLMPSTAFYAMVLGRCTPQPRERVQRIIVHGYAVDGVDPSVIARHLSGQVA